MEIKRHLMLKKLQPQSHIMWESIVSSMNRTATLLSSCRELKKALHKLVDKGQID